MFTIKNIFQAFILTTVFLLNISTLYGECPNLGDVWINIDDPSETLLITQRSGILAPDPNDKLKGITYYEYVINGSYFVAPSRIFVEDHWITIECYDRSQNPGFKIYRVHKEKSEDHWERYELLAEGKILRRTLTNQSDNNHEFSSSYYIREGMLDKLTDSSMTPAKKHE